MLTGHRFKMKTSTLATDLIDGKRVSVAIPAGATVNVIAGPGKGDRMVDVLWEGRTLVMFAIDVTGRGEEIADRA